MTKKSIPSGRRAIVAAILFIATDPVRAGEPPEGTPPVRWVSVLSIDDNIVKMKKEIAIDTATAAKMFCKESSRLRDGWEKHIPEKVETAADARSIPDGVKGGMQRARDEKPYARVIRFSEKELIVAVVERRGNYLWHQYYECKAAIRVPRGKEVDEWFGGAALDKMYGSVYKGLKQGDPESEVTKTLGAPDATIRYQPVGYYRLCYFKDNVIVTINGGRLESFEFDVPQSLKDEVKEKGPALIRY